MKNEHVESFPLTDRFDYLSRAWSKRQKKIKRTYLYTGWYMYRICRITSSILAHPLCLQSPGVGTGGVLENE